MIKNSKKLKLQLIVGGSSILDKYGELTNIIESDGFKINKKLAYLLEGENPETMAKSTGLAIIQISSALSELKPDMVITIGDRYETMATTISTSYMNIPLAHTMGGEESGTIDESIRHATSKFSNIHFVSTKKSKENVIKLGENKKNIFNVGCPRIDELKKIIEKPIINLNKKLHNLGVGKEFDLNKKFFIIMQYAVTTEYTQAKKQILNTLNAVSKFKTPTLVFWPNSDAGSDFISKGIRTWREENLNKDFWFLKNLPIEIFYNLLKKTSCLIGNSSIGIRECSYLGIPFVNIGTRQSNRERGFNVVESGYSKNQISINIEKALNKKIKTSKLYGNGNAGKKIVKIIENLSKLEIQKKLYY